MKSLKNIENFVYKISGNTDKYCKCIKFGKGYNKYCNRFTVIEKDIYCIACKAVTEKRNKNK